LPHSHKRELVIKAWIYFWTFTSVPLVNVYILTHMSPCRIMWGFFLVRIEAGKYKSFSFVFFSRVFWLLWVLRRIMLNVQTKWATAHLNQCVKLLHWQMCCLPNMVYVFSWSMIMSSHLFRFPLIYINNVLWFVVYFLFLFGVFGLYNHYWLILNLADFPFWQLKSTLECLVNFSLLPL
jgi:hypothetical protein